MSAETINNAYFMAMESMATLNRNAALLMRKYASHGATDVTGFGILGHAENLAAAQHDKVDLIMHSLPVFDGMTEHVSGMPDFKVAQGYSAETSGGILTMLQPEKARDFIAELEQEHGQKSWIVGQVVKGDRKAKINDDVSILSVNESFLLK